MDDNYRCTMYNSTDLEPIIWCRDDVALALETIAHPIIALLIEHTICNSFFHGTNRAH